MPQAEVGAEAKGTHFPDMTQSAQGMRANGTSWGSLKIPGQKGG